MRRLLTTVLICGFAISAGAGFEEWFPWIYEHCESSATNFHVGGLVTNSTGIISKSGPNEWTFYFPAGGIFTQVTADTTFTNTINVGGGLLTISGGPQSGNNVISLDYDDLIEAGILSVDGLPQDSWVLDTVGDNIRIKTYDSGLMIRNYADNDYRDLIVRNLQVEGDETIVNIQTLNLTTNQLWMNHGWTGAPTMSAWIKIERGDEEDAWLGWREEYDAWYCGTESNLTQLTGSVYIRHDGTVAMTADLNFGSQDGTNMGNLFLSSDIHHLGDVDTYFRFQPDRIMLITADRTMLNIVASPGTTNISFGDDDFIIDVKNNVLLLQGNTISNGTLGLGITYQGNVIDEAYLDPAFPTNSVLTAWPNIDLDYTDDFAASTFTTHTNNASAHHTRYADAEATNAVKTAWPNLDTNSVDDFDGAWGSLSGVPAGFSDGIDNTNDAISSSAAVTNAVKGAWVNLDLDYTDDFDTSLFTTHTSNVSAHHIRYADAEATNAVKTAWPNLDMNSTDDALASVVSTQVWSYAQYPLALTNTAAYLLARANHTGSQTASTISDFDAEVGNHTDVTANTAARHTKNADTDLEATFEATFVKKTDTVNVLSDITSAGADIEDAVTKRHTQNADTALGTQTQALDMGGCRIVGLLGPVADQQAATKKYVDDIVGGGGTVIKSNWGYVSGDGDSSCSTSVTFATVFTGIPDIIVNCLGYKNGTPANRGDVNIGNNYICTAQNPSTVGFILVATDVAGSSIPAGTVTELDYMEYTNDAAVQAAYVSSDVDVVEKSFETGTGTDQHSYRGDAGGADYWSAWRFTTTTTVVCCAASSFTTNKLGNPTGDWTFKIETDSGGKPSGTLVHPSASNVVAYAGITTNAWNKCLFTPFNLSPGNYWLVENIPDQVNNTAWFVSRDDDGTGFMGYSTDHGASWAIYTNQYVEYRRIYKINLQSYSESTIKQQGSYSLRGLAETNALNDTLTRTVSPTINLTGVHTVDFDIRSNRTGSNITISVHDSGGVTTKITPNVVSTDTWQNVDWDISGVSNANKNAIDSIIITITNAAAANTFYVDNMFGEIIARRIVYSWMAKEPGSD